MAQTMDMSAPPAEDPGMPFVPGYTTTAHASPPSIQVAPLYRLPRESREPGVHLQDMAYMRHPGMRGQASWPSTAIPARRQRMWKSQQSSTRR